ncbi:hypothetical protein Hokovirus_5_15 [Hokovirus HKV1]|uniref:Uncharacterized protein n=1 Tax=Hokovirus HKV1 TaxID=1977638 RepID=A0A1V0SHE6_9VIRU|nr:hypothetical protein Hokovirus_5_15 [Hokovirus HKV1]
MNDNKFLEYIKNKRHIKFEIYKNLYTYSRICSVKIFNPKNLPTNKKEERIVKEDLCFVKYNPSYGAREPTEINMPLNDLVFLIETKRERKELLAQL